MLEIGILKNFDSGTYKAGVQLAGSLTTYFDDVSVAKNIPSGALVVGNYVILAIPGGNPKDACIIATWPQGTPGGGGSKIQDADGDTSWDVEQSADEDKIHGKVKGVEAFLLEDDGILTLAKQPACRVGLSSTQSVPTSTATKLEYATVYYDVLSEFDTTNHRYVATEAGKYLVAYCIWIKQLADQKIFMGYVYKNGTVAGCGARQGNGAPSDDLFISAVDVMDLAANDYLEVITWHNHGANRNFEPAAHAQYFTICKLA